MSLSRFLGVALVTLAFSVLYAAPSSAAEVSWQFLPGSVGEHFTGQLKEGATIFLQEQGGGTFSCSHLTIELESGELIKEGSISGKDATSAIATLDFSGCNSLDAPHSKGDKTEVILVLATLHNCLIEFAGKAKQDGVLVLELETSLEFAGKVIAVVTGAFVAPISKIGVSQYQINAAQKEGAQEVKLCEGGTEESLLSLRSGAKEAVRLGLSMNAVITFDKAKDTEEVLA